MRSTPPLALGAIVLYSITTTHAAAQRWFSSPLVFERDTIALAVADLDGDGDDDILAADGTDFFVRLNRGNADFMSGARFAQPIGYQIGGDSPLLADFDGNGTVDVALTDATGVLVMPGNGDGTFAAAIQVPLPERGALIDAGDFDQAGITDIVVASGRNLIEVRWISWSGTQFQTTAPIIAPGVFDAASLAVGDIDGNGAADAVISRNGAGHLRDDPHRRRGADVRSLDHGPNALPRNSPPRGRRSRR